MHFSTEEALRMAITVIICTGLLMLGAYLFANMQNL